MEDKRFPRYDDHAHIDSAAVDYPPKTPEDYTEEYLKLRGAAVRPPEQGGASPRLTEQRDG
ncbi:MAG: hypothetical protein J6L72_09910 [Butyricicoccus sp.]|nr:hypothetical protein [Butyricicoccus sp.]